MKILIIEDEHLAAEKLKATTLSIDPAYEVLDIINTVDEAIDWLNKNEAPDLILSDIHLADGISFSIYSEVKVTSPIIFTTAYEKYAIKAFEVNSVDYLLKPVTKERLELAIEKYNTLTNSKTEDQSALYTEFKNLLSQSNKEYKSRFLCKLGNKIKSIPTSSISYFFSKDKMTFIIDVDGNRLPVNNTLDEIDNLIDPTNFFRLNRQFITNFDAIDEIHPYFKGRLKLKLKPASEDDIVISTERTPLFKAWLDR